MTQEQMEERLKSAYTYENRADNWNGMQLTHESAYYFGGVPLIEYKNGEECQGDFEQIIPLIDAYNLLMSDRVNDKEQFVNSFLFLKGIDIDSEQAKKLKEEKILCAYEDGDAKYLSEALSESDAEILRGMQRVRYVSLLTEWYLS